jgi:hypothetical protein
MCVTKKWADHITQGRPTNPTGLFTFETARSETPDNLWEITFRLTNVMPKRNVFVSRGITVYGTHTHTHIYVCVCVCVCDSVGKVNILGSDSIGNWDKLSYDHLSKSWRLENLSCLNLQIQKHCEWVIKKQKLGTVNLLLILI